MISPKNEFIPDLDYGFYFCDMLMFACPQQKGFIIYIYIYIYIYAMREERSEYLRRQINTNDKKFIEEW